MSRGRIGAALAGALLLASGASGACVPATDDQNPRGAAGFSFSPSAATGGEPFATADGYTVTIERLLIVLNAAAEGGSNDGTGTLFPGTTRLDLFGRAVPVGRRTVSLRFDGTIFLNESTPDPNDAPTEVDLTAAESARFRARPDFEPSTRAGVTDLRPRGPVVLLRARAAGPAGATRLDLTLATRGRAVAAFPDRAVDVTKDALATVPVQVRAEALFREDGRLLYGAFAEADVDHDGELSPAELKAAAVVVGESDADAAAPTSLADLLASRAARILDY